METDLITISVVSHKKLVNTFKPCLFLACHCQEDQLIHVVRRGDVPIPVLIYVHQKDIKSVGHNRDENLTALHNIGSSLGRNPCS